MVRIKEIEITNPELDAFEDLIFTWALCRKHVGKSCGKSEVEIFKMQAPCKACQREVKKIRNRCSKLWHKLVRAYDGVK
ncbi:hypothetical protein HZC08_02335 [Candidatus Micrarchaeota archaeon]|nr:hypothetical protein [Candidatus Micrarchaeota archaeon]